MSIRIETETLPNNGRILHLTGRITMGEGAQTFERAIGDLLASPAKLLILNLSGVQYIDSTGMGELVSAYIKAQNAGHRLVLAGLTARVRDLLAITKLKSIFEIYDDVDIAAKQATG